MPLPAALLARLAKRGIVSAAKGMKNLKETSKTCLNSIFYYYFILAENYSETFAEDFSEKDDSHINPENYEYRSNRKDDNIWSDKVKRRFKETTKGVKGCPNKWNVFHICTVFCLERWREGVNKPSKSYKERYFRLIKRYPLPKNWISVWDNGCEAYYFWNKNDDSVSWLPPKHPKAVIGKAASTLRSEKDRPDLDAMEDEPQARLPLMPSTNRSPPPTEENRYQRPAPVLPKKTKSRDLEKILRTKKGRKQFHETSEKLDPMDPAAYSDCGRGKWSSGLNVEGEGKTGVDSTASGQLFQQRPYPSPGDILKANQAAKRKDSDDDDEESHKRSRYSGEE